MTRQSTASDTSQPTVAMPARSFPVFSGLEESHLSGKEIAEIVGVTPPTISKWRLGRARVPAETLVFLTMILADWLDGVRARVEAGAPAPEWLEAAERCLERQEAFNTRLSPAAIHKGAHMFQAWWKAHPDLTPEVLS